MKRIFLVFFILFTTAGISGQSQSVDREKELAQATDLTAQLTQLFKARRLNEALPLAEKVVEIRQRLLPDDPLLGTAHANLGEVFFELKKDQEAEQSFNRALTVFEAKSESNAELIAKTLDRVGYLRFLKQDYQKAASLYLRSIEIKDKKLGETNPETIQSLKNFACANFLGTGFSKDESKSKGKLRARAVCWLGGFKDNCGAAKELESGGVLNGKALKLVKPPYSSEARQKRISGKVLIAVLIDEAGNVIKAKPVCGGHPELATGSLQSAYASKFSPTKVNGQPVQVDGIIVYNFVVQ